MNTLLIAFSRLVPIFIHVNEFTIWSTQFCHTWARSPRSGTLNVNSSLGLSTGWRMPLISKGKTSESQTHHLNTWYSDPCRLQVYNNIRKKCCWYLYSQQRTTILQGSGSNLGLGLFFWRAKRSGEEEGRKLDPVELISLTMRMYSCRTVA